VRKREGRNEKTTVQEETYLHKNSLYMRKETPDSDKERWVSQQTERWQQSI
jgi:hypothetical protein